jgi:hypothetical protein
VGGFQVKNREIAIYPIYFWLFGLVPNGILREDSSSDILNKLNGNGNGSAWYPSWLAKHDGWSVGGRSPIIHFGLGFLYTKIYSGGRRIRSVKKQRGVKERSLSCGGIPLLGISNSINSNRVCVGKQF